MKIGLFSEPFCPQKKLAKAKINIKHIQACQNEKKYISDFWFRRLCPRDFKITHWEIFKNHGTIKIPMFSLIQLNLLDKNSIKYGRKIVGKCLHLHFSSYVSEIFVNIFERFSENSHSKSKDIFREILKSASTRLWSTNYIVKRLSNTPLANLLVQ